METPRMVPGNYSLWPGEVPSTVMVRYSQGAIRESPLWPHLVQLEASVEQQEDDPAVLKILNGKEVGYLTIRQRNKVNPNPSRRIPKFQIETSSGEIFLIHQNLCDPEMGCVIKII